MKTPELIDINKLVPYENNVKKHGDDQVAKIAASIDKHGWRGNPIIVDKNFVIIAGHGRRLAALKLGMNLVPVVVESEMTESEVRAFRLADNRAAISDIDHDLFEQEMLEFPDLLTSLEGIFDKKELDFSITDVMAIDNSVFENDLSDAVASQQEQTDQRIEENKDKSHKLSKLLGFDSVMGQDAFFVTRFIGALQAKSGEDAQKAFVAHAKAYIEGQGNE